MKNVIRHHKLQAEIFKETGYIVCPTYQIPTSCSILKHDGISVNSLLITFLSNQVKKIISNCEICLRLFLFRQILEKYR